MSTTDPQRIDVQSIFALLDRNQGLTVGETLDRLAPLAAASPRLDAGLFGDLFNRLSRRMATAAPRSVPDLTHADRAYLLHVVANAVSLLESIRISTARSASGPREKSYSTCMERCESEYERCRSGEDTGTTETECALALRLCTSRCKETSDEPPSAFGAVLYEHADFSGDMLVLEVGVYDDLGVFKFDEKTSSIRVVPGYRVNAWNNKNRAAQRHDFVDSTPFFDEFGISSVEIVRR